MGKKARRRERAAELVETSSAIAERHGFDAGGLLGHESSYAVNVSEQVALAVPVFYTCVRLIADLVADGDVGEFRGTERLEPASRIVLRPWRGEFGEATRRQWIQLSVACMAMYNGVWLERPFGLRDSEGVAQALVPIAPTRIARVGPNDWRKDGQPIDRAHLRWVPRMSWPTVTSDLGTVIRLARDTIAAAWAAQAYQADFWQAGGAPVIVISTDQALTNDQATEISDRWATRRAEAPGKPAVIGRGGKAAPLGADVAAAGTADAAEKLGQGIAQFLGVPAWLANVPAAAGSLVYQNSSSAGLDLVRYNLRPGYAGPLGDAWSDELPGGYLTGRRVVIGLDHLTEGTVLEQYQAYEIATGRKSWMLPSEVRARLHMPIDMTLDEQGAPAPAIESIPEAANA